MKSILITLFAMISLNAAALEADKEQTAILAGAALTETLQSDLASDDAKELVRAILSGPQHDLTARVSSASVHLAPHKIFVNLIILVEVGDEEGGVYEAAYELEVQMTESDEGVEAYFIHLELIAG